MASVSVGIMAFNEERTIGSCLSAVAGQRTERASIREIIVVASGCTDRTEDVIRAHAARDGTIRLLSQPTRQGKAAAINTFLSAAEAPYLVITNADTIMAPDCLGRLIGALDADPRAGIACGRPWPVSPTGGLSRPLVDLHWLLHHQISLARPKVGEILALRRVVPRISEATWTDEAELHSQVEAEGWTVRYVPEAVVYVAGPGSLRDLLRQRRRIHAGHLDLQRRRRFVVSTLPVSSCLFALANVMRLHPRLLAVLPLAMPWEALCRALGWWDFYTKPRDGLWPPIPSTKRLPLTALPHTSVGDDAAGPP